MSVRLCLLMDLTDPEGDFGGVGVAGGPWSVPLVAGVEVVEVEGIPKSGFFFSISTVFEGTFLEFFVEGLETSSRVSLAILGFRGRRAG